MGRMVVNAQSGPVRIDAAYIRVSPQTTFEILGESAVPGDEVDDAIFQTMRTFRPIEDRARLHPVPARVELATAPAAGTLAELLPRMGASGISADETAVVNNLELDQPLTSGKTLKLVRPSAKR